MFILAASSLHHALKKLSLALQKRVSQSCLAIPGLSFNHNAVNLRKTFGPGRRTKMCCTLVYPVRPYKNLLQYL